jgi:hypothetical protein
MIRLFNVPFLLLLLGNPTVTAFSQSQRYVFIFGTIIDHETKQPLPQASISLSNRDLGTSSNDLGKFRLRVPEQFSGDTLVVTYLGYKKFKDVISNLKSKSSLTIPLVPQATMLKEVSVFWNKLYSPEELKEDYEKFCSILEEVHTGLFDYLPESKWSMMKDSTLQLCKEPMTHREFFQLIALHVAKIRNSHTHHGVTNSWIRQKSDIFPFNVRYINEKLYVSESLTSELTLTKGTEILEINGRSPDEIKTKILPFIPADGYIETGKMAMLNSYFPWFLALFVEEPREFTIRYKSPAGNIETSTVSGYKESFRNFGRILKSRTWRSALELEIDNTLKTAYFRIEDSRLFNDSLRIYFKRILDANVQALIIDLRSYGGIREEEQVAQLYSHLVDKPFRVYERMEVQSNSYQVFDKDFTYRPYANSLKQIKEKYFDKLVDSGKGYFLWESESYMGTLQPANLRYSGNVYILTDGRNQSASTDFTSLASHLDNVFTIGEETGGEYRSYVSGAMFGLVLPNSKIGVKVPTWKSILAVEEKPSQRGRGVLPDFHVTQSLDDFMSGHDTVKEFAYELIKEMQNEPADNGY